MIALFKRCGTKGSVSALLSGTALCTALFVSATTFPALADEYTFSSVVIDGNNLIEPATILKLAAIPKGQQVDDATLNDAVQRLNDSGLFSKVALEPNGGKLVIHVTENATISTVAFEGNQKLKSEDLQKIIKSQSRKVFSATQAEADAATIADAYAHSGRLAARVEPKVIKRDGNKVDLVFEIREGRNSEVERITFTGNQAYSDRRLRQVIGSKQAGLLRAFIQRDTYSPESIPADQQMLLDFYHDRGYIDATVRGVSSQMSDQRDGFFLTFDVHEGQQYHIGKVSTLSEYAGVDAADFAKVVKVRAGQTYTPVAIDETVSRMEAIALKKGIDFVSVEPRITRNERDQSLDVTFVVTKGPRVFVERIDIEGNATTADKVVRRQFETVEGDPLNQRAIREAAERIRALGYFKNADVEAKPGTTEDQTIIDVNVEEQPTGSLSFGASYSVSDGLGFNIGLKEANFLGRGQTIGVKIGTTSKNNDSSFTFVEPNLLDRDLKFSVNAYYASSDNSHARYSTTRIGISPAIEFPIGEKTRLELHYKLSNDELRDVSTDSSLILQNEAALGRVVTSALGYKLSYDTRIKGLDPTLGLLLEFGQDFAGVGGDVTSVNTTTQATVQKKIMHEEVTLKAEAEAGVLVTQGGDSLFLSRYTGNGLVRGFETNGIGPRDLSAVNEDALGGNMYAALRLNAQFPIGLPEEYGITGGLFADMGSVWGLDNAPGIDDGMHLRSSVGFSIFWDSALGPLEMDFAHPIAKEDYDHTQTFNLTVSTKF